MPYAENVLLSNFIAVVNLKKMQAVFSTIRGYSFHFVVIANTRLKTLVSFLKEGNTFCYS